MSLQSWLQNSWLVQHATSPDEIKNLLAISDRDLVACQVKQLPADWRCSIAYNAALQAATAALAAVGYRATRDNHHYRVIQSLEFTTAPSRKFIDTLDGFRKKRNVSSYDVAGAVSDKEIHGSGDPFRCVARWCWDSGVLSGIGNYSTDGRLWE